MTHAGAADVTVVRTCGPYESLYYAAAGGDFNPIHVDDAFARAQGLPGMILQGLCTLSWLVEAAIDHAGDPSRIGGVAARFHRPVLVGDAVTFAGRAASGALAFEVTNQRGEEVLRHARVDLRDTVTPPAPGTPAPGRAYGPFRYAVGAEKVREFAQAIHGHPPGRVYPQAVAGLPPRYSHGDASLVPPPTFCVNFAIQPFLAAFFDPDLGIDFARVVHGEQAFRFGRPPRVGEVVETTGTLVRSFEKTGHRFIVVATESRGTGGDTLVTAEWTAVVRRTAQ